MQTGTCEQRRAGAGSALPTKVTTLGSRDVRERPILFSAPMVHALLDGRKTQTRRAMKNQPPREEDFFGSSFGLDRAVADGVKMYSQNDYDRLPKHPTDWQLLGSVGVARGAGFPDRYRCPHGGPGDRLWVREAWKAPDRLDRVPPRDMPADTRISYMADDRLWPCSRGRPGIHMPRWASRITLEITGVRVERLQDISPADAIAEGIRRAENDFGNGPSYCDYGMGDQDDTAEWFASPIDSYQSLWNAINGSGSWAVNPWVWVVEFERSPPMAA